MVDVNSKLMREFVEFEGLSDQVIDFIDDSDGMEEEQAFRPGNAAQLSSSDIYYEMEKRHMKTTGFQDTDREILQKVFNEEFQKDYEEAKARRREIKRRQAQQAGLMKRRMLMEKLLQEEQDEISRNHQIGLMIEFVKENSRSMPQSLRLEINSISARSLAKAMWCNETIVSLDLSSNNLDDHGGIYLARMLNKNSRLERLELDNNFLGPQTCLAFSESLQKNSTLKHLSLDSNMLATGTSADANGFRKFIEALRVNKSLASLNLWRTGINPTLGSHLADAIEENNTLLFLDIGKNDINVCDVKRIFEKIDSNLKEYEINERARRSQVEKQEQILNAEREVEENKLKKVHVATWLEERRNHRAEVRRKGEEDRIANMIADAEEQRRLAELDREEARKAAEEAAAKKAKKNKNKKGGKGAKK